MCPGEPEGVPLPMLDPLAKGHKFKARGEPRLDPGRVLLKLTGPVGRKRARVLSSISPRHLCLAWLFGLGLWLGSGFATPLEFASSDFQAQLKEALRSRNLGFVHDTFEGKKLHQLALPRLQRELNRVRTEPLPITFSRLVPGLTTPTVDEVGQKVEAYLAVPVRDPRWDRWVRYLETKTPSPGAKSVRFALTLRRQARIYRWVHFVEQALGKPEGSWSEADLEGLRSDRQFQTYLADIFQPVVLIFAEAHEAPRTGPAHSPTPTVSLVDADLVPGSENFLGLAAAPRHGPILARRTDSLLVLQDIPGILEVEDSIQRDSLGDVLVHEIFHGIQGDLTVGHPLKDLSQSRSGHKVHLVTDRYLAFVEGFAEMAEAFTGADHPGFSNRNGASTLQPFLLGRQDPIRRNRYIQERFQKFVVTRSGRRQSRIKTGSQMLANEGVVASVLYQIWSHDDVPDAFELTFRVLIQNQPQDLLEFVAGMAQVARTEKAKRAILLGFLHATRFATVSAEARRAYQDQDQARLEYRTAKNEGHVLADQLLEHAQKAQDLYQAIVRPLAKQVLEGTLPLDSALGPELWVEDLSGKDTRRPYRYDLNSLSAANLEEMGLSPAGIQTFLGARDKFGSFENLRPLRRVLSASDFERIAETRENYRSGLLDELHGHSVSFEGNAVLGLRGCHSHSFRD